MANDEDYKARLQVQMQHEDVGPVKKIDFPEISGKCSAGRKLFILLPKSGMR